MDGHCFAVLHSLNEKRNGLNCFWGSRFFLNNKNPFLELNAFSRTFMTHLDPNVDQLILQVFFFPLDDPSSHLFVLKEEAINMQNRRYLHDFQIAVFFAGGVGGDGGWRVVIPGGFCGGCLNMEDIF